MGGSGPGLRNQWPGFCGKPEDETNLAKRETPGSGEETSKNGGGVEVCQQRGGDFLAPHLLEYLAAKQVAKDKAKSMDQFHQITWIRIH